MIINAAYISSDVLSTFIKNYCLSYQETRLVPGAGACEIELARKIESYGEV